MPEWISSITIGGAGIWTIVGLIAVAIIRQRPITQRLVNEREGNLLKERASEMRGMRATIARLEAEQRIDRHSLANLEQCLDTLLDMIEFSPDRAKEAAAKIKAKLAEGKAAIAAEKAGIHARAIAAATVAAAAEESALTSGEPLGAT